MRTGHRNAKAGGPWPRRRLGAGSKALFERDQKDVGIRVFARGQDTMRGAAHAAQTAASTGLLTNSLNMAIIGSI